MSTKIQLHREVDELYRQSVIAYWVLMNAPKKFVNDRILRIRLDKYYELRARYLKKANELIDLYATAEILDRSSIPFQIINNKIYI